MTNGLLIRICLDEAVSQERSRVGQRLVYGAFFAAAFA